MLRHLNSQLNLIDDDLPIDREFEHTVVSPLFHESPSIAVVTLSTENVLSLLGIDAVSIFGILLEYPVVYTYKSESLNAHSTPQNCLAMQPLHLVEIWIRKQAPGCFFAEKSEQHSQECDFSEFEHCLLKFSIPESIYEQNCGEIFSLASAAHLTFGSFVVNYVVDIIQSRINNLWAEFCCFCEVRESITSLRHVVL